MTTVGNCIGRRNGEKNEFRREYYHEYSLLLTSVIERRRKACNFLNKLLSDSSTQQQLIAVENAYMVRIFGKLIIEIRNFLSECLEAAR